MELKKFCWKYRKGIDNLIKFARKCGLTVEFLPEKELGGAGGLYCAESKKIILPNNLKGMTTNLILAHEIGHFISELNGEVSSRQNKVYEESYPEKPGDKVLEKDAKIMRYIEARAIYYGNKLIKKFKIDIKEKDIEIDNLYAVLSLEHIFKHGELNKRDVEQVYNESKLLYQSGIRWTDYYKDFL